jgi:hypothetical protein
MYLPKNITSLIGNIKESRWNISILKSYKKSRFNHCLILISIVEIEFLSLRLLSWPNDTSYKNVLRYEPSITF